VAGPEGDRQPDGQIQSGGLKKKHPNGVLFLLEATLLCAAFLGDSKIQEN
jgi:hypothetical protein